MFVRKNKWVEILYRDHFNGGELSETALVEYYKFLNPMGEARQRSIYNVILARFTPYGKHFFPPLALFHEISDNLQGNYEARRGFDGKCEKCGGSGFYVYFRNVLTGERIYEFLVSSNDARELATHTRHLGCCSCDAGAKLGNDKYFKRGVQFN